MPNLTLTITDGMKDEMKRHPSVRWSNAVRVSIEKKLRDFELSEKLAQKTDLTEKDVEALSAKVDNALAKHAERLLNEGNN